MPPADTCPVTFSVTVRPVRRGRVLAVADAVVDLDGVPLTLSGFTVRLTDHGRADVLVPQHRDPVSGQWADSVVLPPELAGAIGREILAACGIRAVG